MLPWSKSRDTVDKLTVGSMARYTLASYAIRDAGLREYLRSELARQPAAVKAPLGEVVEAADTVQIAALRKDALAAVDELKTKGSDSRRNLDFWGQVGVGAVALGCVSAAALGQVAVGIPCVIGGSAARERVSRHAAAIAVPRGENLRDNARDRRRASTAVGSRSRRVKYSAGSGATPQVRPRQRRSDRPYRRRPSAPGRRR